MVVLYGFSDKVYLKRVWEPYIEAQRWRYNTIFGVLEEVDYDEPNVGAVHIWD